MEENASMTDRKLATTAANDNGVDAPRAYIPDPEKTGLPREVGSSQ